jgi:adenylate cyclase
MAKHLPLLARPLSDGVRRIVDGYLDVARRTLGGLSEDDPETLHDFRVTLRRAHATLRAYGPRLRAVRPKERRRLRGLVRATNAGRDADVLLGYQTAWNLVFLGRPDQGVERARENVATARRIGHPFSIAAALAMETVVHAMRRDFRRLRERAEETIAFSEANGFPFWLGIGRMLHACARILDGEHDAVDDLVGSVRESGGSGSLAGATALLSLVADACLCAGKLGEARGQVELGLALAARTGEHMVDAEFHRLTAEIGLAEGAAPGDAEASFVHSLEIARGQQAKGMELRTATGLARLWRDQGRQGEAKRLLAPCYEAFSEGFDTADLREAKALRDEL